jgi:hypothetical protein
LIDCATDGSLGSVTAGLNGWNNPAIPFELKRKRPTEASRLRSDVPQVLPSAMKAVPAWLWLQAAARWLPPCRLERRRLPSAQVWPRLTLWACPE